jgi:phosphatidylglycerophosphate synthase
MKIELANIPSILVGLRFVIAPLLLLDAIDRQTGLGFIVAYIIAVLSDIFDGIIARRLGVSTPRLRQADSWADLSLYVCIAASVWLVHPEVVRQFQVPLLTCLAAQLTLHVVCLAKLKNFPSFHTYTAKAWGLTLLVATISLFGFDRADLLWGAIVLCLVNSLEEIAMVFILPEWHCDVLSLFHALKLRHATISAAPESIDLH